MFGCVDTVGPQVGDIARTAWLAAGLPMVTTCEGGGQADVTIIERAQTRFLREASVIWARSTKQARAACEADPGAADDISSSGRAGSARRARRIDGLRVADASIMPGITGGNTNAPAMMIGEHCASLRLGQRMDESVAILRGGYFEYHGRSSTSSPASAAAPTMSSPWCNPERPWRVPRYPPQVPVAHRAPRPFAHWRTPVPHPTPLQSLAYPPPHASPARIP